MLSSNSGDGVSAGKAAFPDIISYANKPNK